MELQHNTALDLSLYPLLGREDRPGAGQLPLFVVFKKKKKPLLIGALKGYNLLEKHAGDEQPHRPLKRDFSRFMEPLCTVAPYLHSIFLVLG